MAEQVDTWVTGSRSPDRTTKQACLVQIYPTDGGMGTRHELAEENYAIGRGEECEIRLQDHSVSRQHATVMRSSSGGYLAADNQSTNGTFINDEPIEGSRPFRDGDYLRVGNCILRFLAGGNVEAEYHEELYRMTILDGLTELHNQRYLMEFLDREIVRASRHHRPLSIVMLDIDDFKGVNDKMGHLVGDFALRELAQIVRREVRREDLLARYGGEEFALVLVEADARHAVETAERIRIAVEKHQFVFDDKEFQITLSCGVAECRDNPSNTVAGLIKRADEKLLEAKRGGRNRVVG